MKQNYGQILPFSGPRKSFGMIPGSQGRPGLFGEVLGGPRGPKCSETVENQYNYYRIPEIMLKKLLDPYESL